MSAIEVRDLRKAYADVEAVAGVSFDVAQGECLALLGPNGAGKITATEILDDYRKADSGYARVLGVDPGQGGLDWKAQLGSGHRQCVMCSYPMVRKWLKLQVPGIWACALLCWEPGLFLDSF